MAALHPLRAPARGRRPGRGAPAIGARAEGPGLERDRRDRGRGDDITARGRGGQPQLGLPLLVDPRLDASGARARRDRLRRRGRRVPALHPAQLGGARRRPPDHLRRRRRAAADRVRARRLRATAARARAGRQRRRRPAPERRARRARAARVALAPARPLARRRHVAVRLRPGRHRRRALGRARRRHLGERATPRPLRPLEGDVLGGARSRARACGRVHAARARAALEA